MHDNDIFAFVVFIYVFVGLITAFVAVKKDTPVILAVIWPLMLIKHLIEEAYKYFSHWNFK